MSDREQQEKGRITIEVKDQPYTLVFDLNAMASLEDALSTPEREITFDQIMQRCLQGSVKYTRALVWAALHRHQPTMTFQDVGTWIQDAGGLEAVKNLAVAAAGLAQPDPKDAKALEETHGRPRQARTGRKRGGTGGKSPFARVKSV